MVGFVGVSREIFRPDSGEESYGWVGGHYLVDKVQEWYLLCQSYVQSTGAKKPTFIP